jgi:hypothetical protein
VFALHLIWHLSSLYASSLIVLVVWSCWGITGLALLYPPGHLGTTEGMQQHRRNHTSNKCSPYGEYRVKRLWGNEDGPWCPGHLFAASQPHARRLMNIEKRNGPSRITHPQSTAIDTRHLVYLGNYQPDATSLFKLQVTVLIAFVRTLATAAHCLARVGQKERRGFGRQAHQSTAP